MRCAWTSERLSEYLDNRLPLDELFQLRAHLRDCSRCRKEYDELNRVRYLLNRSRHDQGLKTLPTTPQRSRGHSRSRAGTIAAGLILAVGVLLAWLLGGPWRMPGSRTGGQVDLPQLSSPPALGTPAPEGLPVAYPGQESGYSLPLSTGRVAWVRPLSASPGAWSGDQTAPEASLVDVGVEHLHALLSQHFLSRVRTWESQPLDVHRAVQEVQEADAFPVEAEATSR